ncbi:hypothetical protein Leryth_016872 [Lithospermum erythrorhizon]|uniref:mannan endo-1,4-beta-mannosidase n=1 Tax=Lithospermum erythrorhizon TaxID=34254 RepID=A0AAV3NZQ2_LITER|nr:hypothetical protein Leryth_016872 [Lithospermum erythrorhizon]
METSYRCTINFTSIVFLLMLFIRTTTSNFVQTRGTKFVLNNSPFLFNGFNSYWMMHVASDPSERYKVSNVFKEAAATGLTVCRTWAFCDGGSEALQISPGAYDERVFQGLDFVVSEARKYNIKLILSLINNYKDFGGRPQYVEWARKVGAEVKGDDDFYTNSVVKGYYKNHIKKLFSRINKFTHVAYANDPTIMGWELINEPRCKVDYSGKIVNAWVQEMASYVKSMNGNQMLSVGMEGFYGDSIPSRKQYNPGYQVGTDFISNHLVKEIDFATIHAYPDAWLIGENDGDQMRFMQRWIMSHSTDSKTILKKPLIFSEFGKSNKDPGFNIKTRDSFMSSIYKYIYGLAQNGALAGGLVWQLLANEMEPYDDGYGIVLSQNPSTRSVIYQQSKQMRILEHNRRLG